MHNRRCPLDKGWLIFGQVTQRSEHFSHTDFRLRGIVEFFTNRQ